MLETLFKRPSILTRYQEAPYLYERECYLSQCAENGYSLSMLHKIAWIQLSVSHSIQLNRGKITMDNIEKAINERAYFINMSNNKQNSQSSHQLFIHIVSQWLNSLGYLEMPSDEKSPFKSYITDFVSFLDERGLSPVTISTRCERLEWFFNYLSPHHHLLQTITISDIDGFIKTKSDQGWKRSSLASLASSLRSFFHYAESKKWCAVGIAKAIETPRIYTCEDLPEGPKWEDVQKLLDSTRGNSPADIRDHAILILLSVYGFRRGEVAQLKLDDIDWVHEQIKILHSKQYYSQTYPLVFEVGEAILRYLRVVRPHCKHRTLFMTLSAPVRPLSPSSISAVARAHLNALGVKLSHNGAHCLRHACAGHLLASGFSLKQIGDQLGHRSANSTLKYTKIDLTGLRQVAELDLGRLL